MSIMRPLSAVFVVLSLSLAAVRAQDKGAAPAPQGAETYEAVNKKYTDAHRAWNKEYRAALEEARKNGKDEPFHFDKPLPDAKFDRIEELFRRTTQFNATGRQFTAAGLASLAASPKALVFALHVSDRFADHGLVGAAVIEDREITGLVMSCRVLGMGVEHEFMQHMMSAVGDGVVSARIVPTSRNIPVRNIYRDNGFVLDQDGVWRRENADDAATSASLVPAEPSDRKQGQLSADPVD